MAAAKKKTPQTSSSVDLTKAYASAVVAGEIVAGPHVRNACRRHLQDLKEGRKRGLRFDLEAANYAFRFFEGMLMLSEGQFEGTPFRLHPSQAFIIGSLFGWKRADGTRRFRRAFIEQGKGNGKSPMAGGIGLYGLTADHEAGAQVYAAAAKKEQAGILFADAVKMVKASAKLKQRLEFSGGEGREYNIAFHPNGSFFRPVSRDTGKTGSGPRPHFVLADEVDELPESQEHRNAGAGLQVPPAGGPAGPLGARESGAGHRPRRRSQHRPVHPWTPHHHHGGPHDPIRRRSPAIAHRPGGQARQSLQLRLRDGRPNIKAAEIVVAAAKEAIGARNEQELMEAIKLDPKAACVFWLNPAFWVSAGFLLMPRRILLDMLFVDPDVYNDTLRIQIVTAILALLGVVGAYWLGTSFSSQRKSDSRGAGG